MLGRSPFSQRLTKKIPTVVGVIVKGHVTFKGNIPKLPPLQVHRDKAFCGESMPDESILVDGQSNGISNIVVNLKGIATGKALAKKAPAEDWITEVVDFYLPILLGVTNSVLEIASADPVLHNTHILRNDETFLNVALPPGREDYS